MKYFQGTVRLGASPGKISCTGMLEIVGFKVSLNLQPTLSSWPVVGRLPSAAPTDVPRGITTSGRYLNRMAVDRKCYGTACSGSSILRALFSRVRDLFDIRAESD